jgi:hypothetical protein
MNTANPPRPPAPDLDTPAGDDSTSVDLTSEPPVTRDSAAGSNKSPRLPHDRDEAVGMTNGRPDARIKQGHGDMTRGVQDTTRSAEADNTYRQLKREGDRGGRKRNR